MRPMINALLDPVVNFGKVTVSGAYTSTATEIQLNTGDGSKLPDPATDGGSFNLVWFNNSTYSDPADDPNVEIVRCITRVGDTLIVIRAQESTVATGKNIPSRIYKMVLSPTKKTIDDIQTESQSKVDTHSALSTGVHGIGIDTIDGVGTRNIAISVHSSIASSIHGFDSSGNAPAQTHGLSRHTGTIGDHAANLSSIGTNSHTQIDSHIGSTVNIHNFDILGNAPAQTHGSIRHDATVETPSGAQSKVDTHANTTTAHGSTSSATASAIIQRDANGRAKVATPSSIDDIARKDTVDTVQTNLGTHAGLTTAHGSSGTVLGLTTANATYAPIANGVTNGNTHNHSVGDGAQINHTTLSNIGTNAHSTIDTAITNSTNHIGAAAPHSGHDTPSQRDIAINTATTNHAGLITGVHGVTGSYILGTEDMGIANGVASLDTNGKIPTSQLPGLALTSIYTVANQVAQLALSTTVNSITQEGDVAIRTDENKSYVRNAGTAGTMADWSLLLTPTDVVTSVFGRTGVVASSNNDYTWDQINKATSSIADITTKSHTALTDIGTYNHATIDAHITSTTAHSSTSAATISTIMQRDAAGRAKVAAPSATDDIAIKDTVDTVQTNLTNHANNTTTAHGTTGAVVGTTNSQILTNKTLTSPTIGDFINSNHTHSAAGATGGVVDHINLANNGTNTHASIDTAITASTSHIGAAAPHSGHDTPSQRDTAITNHAGLITGVHGVTGSYILGTEDMGVANGVASLDSNGKIITSQLPGLALTNIYTVADQTAQLALNTTTQQGDVAIRSDENKSYVRNAGVSGTMADWSLLLTPTDVVTSVFGRTGVVAASNNDYTWNQINKATSSIADITTRSHTALTDIGTYDHATIDTHMTSAAGVHGVTGSVVGTSDGQTLTNKTLTTPTIGSFTNANHTHTAAGATGGVVDHVNLANKGGYTHATIDAHMESATAHGSTSAATASAIIQRDVNGRAKIATPSSIDDIARKDTVDAVQTNLGTHAGLTVAHGSSGAILGVTTADATYAPIAKGVTNGDSHDHNGGDGAQINHTTLSNIGTNTHALIDTAITASTSHIGAAAPHSGHDTPSQRDTAITNHAGLITGVHGVTGSYILGTEDMGIANGVASLDSNGKIVTSQLPGLALTNIYTVANQAAQLALNTIVNSITQEGDVAIRTDENKSYVRNAGTAGTMADWSLLLTPTDVVTSVFGRTGVVAATTNDYTWAQINKTISSIADITTRSHTALTDIGTYNHATIDTHMTSGTGIHGVTGSVVGTSDGQTLTNKILTTPTIGDFTNSNHTHAATGATGGIIDHVNLANKGTNTHTTIDSHIGYTVAHGSSGAILGVTTADATYAPIAKGVTNGDSHDHNGGDGAQINHTTLSNIGTNTHANIDTAISASTSHIGAAAPHSGHEITANRNIANGYAGTDANNYILLARFQPIRTVSTTSTIGTGDYTIVCSTAPITITLPSAVSIPGRIYNIKNASIGTITVGTTSSQTIDGNLTRLISTINESITVQSDNTNWIVI